MSYDGICIAYKNKNSNIRCSRKAKNSSLCCGYHKNGTNLYIDIIKYNFTPEELKLLLKIKSFIFGVKIKNTIKKYFYKILDNKYGEYLITGDTSWKDIPSKYRFLINNEELWDIRFLINHFATQLNNSSSALPSAKYPNNPFTRKLYNPLAIVQFKNKINKLQLKTPIQLHLFLNSSLDKIWNSNKKEQIIINYLEKKLRYQIINQKDSQDNYIGKWVHKSLPKSDFEQLYTEWNNISPYLMAIGNTMIPNPEKQYYQEILDACK